MERPIHIRYGWIGGEPDQSSWESTIFREWGILILVIVIISLRISPAISYALGFTIISMVLNAAISLTMLPKARSIEIYVEPETSVKIKDLFFSNDNSIKFLASASVAYVVALTFTSMEIILAIAIFLNSLYLFPIVKRKFLEYSALKKGFQIIDWTGVKPLKIKRDNNGRFWLDYDGEVQLSYNEAKFLYDLSLMGSNENGAIKKFIALKKCFNCEEWMITPTPNAYIYIMIKKDF